MSDYKEYIKGVWKDRYVIWNLVKQDLQMKYNRSALGIAWSLITPMGLSVIIGLIYSIIFGTDPRSLVPMLFAGLNPWTFISSSADGGTVSYLGAEGYIKQTTVSPQIFPIRIVLVAFVNLLYGIIAFFLVYLFMAPNNFYPRMLMVFPGLLILFIAVIAIANFASVINLFIRDYQPFQSLILQGLFYVTPIIFTTGMLDEKGYSIVYKLNPFYYLIEVVRTPMLGLQLPSLQVYLVAIVMSLIIFIISIKLVMKSCKGLALKL